jgi:hypothetical protein
MDSISMDLSGAVNFPLPVAIDHIPQVWEALGMGELRAVKGRPGTFRVRRAYSVVGPNEGTLELTADGDHTAFRLEAEVELPIDVPRAVSPLLHHAIRQMLEQALTDIDRYMADLEGTTYTGPARTVTDSMDVDVKAEVGYPLEFVAKNLKDYWYELGLGVVEPTAGLPNTFSVARGYAVAGPEYGTIRLSPTGSGTSVHFVGRLGLPMRVPGFGKRLITAVIQKWLGRTVEDSQRFLADRSRATPSCDGLVA